MRRLLLASCVVGLVAAGAGFASLQMYRAPGPLGREADVVVPKGGFAAVARRLRDSGVVRSTWLLEAFALATREQGDVRAMELAFPPAASLQEVLFILRHGRPVQHLVTIPEGVTSARLGQILSAADGLAGRLMLPAEGAFLPESYAYERGSTAEAIVVRGEAAMGHVVERAWATRSAAVTLRDKRELVVLASLVERETHLPAERNIVAAVFLNRLRLGMRLQSDPTVVYAVSGGAGELAHGLRKDELEAPSPYNTYVNAGLPLGAICSPGAASIEAAAHPAASDALYFVADGTGGHAFARSLDEHARNVARYRLGR